MANQVISFRLDKENVKWLDTISSTEIKSDRTKVLNAILTSLRRSELDLESTGLEGLYSRLRASNNTKVLELLEAVNEAKIILDKVSK